MRTARTYADNTKFTIAQFDKSATSGLVAEAGDLNIWQPAETIDISGKSYKLVLTETYGGDTAGWRYTAEDGSRALIIND